MSTEPRMHPPTRHCLAAVLCAATFLLVPATHGQDQARRVTGIVTDLDHETLAGAVVQLRDDTTDTVTSSITNRTGRYTFERISPQDDYHLWASFHGHKSRSRSLSKFDSKPNRDLVLVVKVK